ncbi:fumarylacetoacetate hydrolase family protein [Mycolicibacterium tokaiense]|uniref:2-keto-4-pentenoate hydratase/2-oxohepta-3-ene-1,7-dioic acid hydratase n=1 Tax=Mycolicibacterium tokaiense TaxID=39695 RepID=A0A378THU4_9MYCO|nr:fumarylacetoacetate hydrolase family protein [Mycolicibacterium tokaiense]STZ60114.1 2-keto-4-pentenoate hydratase/2-oxohepta-3-ene-1,7-dioic acid hydratase [Mycolicibacterium tokaiense]
MKFRRVLTDDVVTTEVLGEAGWQTAASPVGPTPFSAEWELATARRHLQQTSALLPFTPLSFRDCLLSEKHSVDAARGMINAFYPGTARITNTFEKLARRTFPAFLPKKLFYRQPIYYMSNALTIVPTGTPVSFPSYSTALDFELEVGFVLSKPLLDATAAQARDAIGAFVLLNDFSARDVQRDEMNTGLGPQKSKHFLTSLSDTAVTADEVLPRLGELTGSVIINGDTVSTVDYSGLQWSAEEALMHFSRDEQLLPGELIGLGTLAGGSGMETGRWLKPGDSLRLELDGIGVVEHRITT